MKTKSLSTAMAAIIFLLFLAGCGSLRAQAQEREQNLNSLRKTYSMAEYNEFTIASQPENPAEKIKLLDAFVAKYPDSPLFAYICEHYYRAYEKADNTDKVMQYAEKRLAAPNLLPYTPEIEPNEKLDAVFAWIRSYNKIRSDNRAVAAKAREIVQTGLALISSLKNLDGRNEETFAKEKKLAATYLNITAARAAIATKDYKSADTLLGVLGELTKYDPSELWPRDIPSPRAL